MAAAPDLPTLFAFEDQIEAAALSLLAAANAPACSERNPGSLVTPRVEVRCQTGMPTGHRRALPGGMHTPSQTLPDAWTAQLILTTVTNRLSTNPPNAQRHSELLGKSRVAMLLAVGGLNTHLTWLRVQKLDDAGVIPAVHANSDLDVSPAVFSLQFEVLADAWPTPLTPA